MGKRNWVIEKKVPDSKLSNVWLSYFIYLKQGISGCNDMDYDPFCTHQIMINYTNDFSKNQDRRKKFIPYLKLVNESYTEVRNGHNDVVIFEIKQFK